MLHKCLCYDLKTGGIIIGWLSLICSVLGLISLSVNITNIKTIVDTMMLNGNIYHLDRSALELGLLKLFIVLISLESIVFISSIILLFGIKKNNFKLLIPYLISLMLAIITNITLATLAVTFAVKHQFPTLVVFCLALPGSIGTSIDIFIWIVIYSLVKLMKSTYGENRFFNSKVEFGGSSRDF